MEQTIDLSRFELLPDDSKVWIHGFPVRLSEEATRRILRRLEAFGTSWVSHGRTVTSACTIAEDQFLITAAHCPGGLSGCSKDSYFRCLKELGEQMQVDPLQTGLVFYRNDLGEICGCDHLECFRLVENGSIRLDTLVFDTLVDSLGVLRRRGLAIPYSDSWHYQTYGEPGSAAVPPGVREPIGA